MIFHITALQFSFPLLFVLESKGGQIYNLYFGLISYTVHTTEIATMYFQTQTMLRIAKTVQINCLMLSQTISDQNG